MAPAATATETLNHQRDAQQSMLENEKARARGEMKTQYEYEQLYMQPKRQSPEPASPAEGSLDEDTVLAELQRLAKIGLTLSGPIFVLTV